MIEILHSKNSKISQNRNLTEKTQIPSLSIRDSSIAKTRHLRIRTMVARSVIFWSRFFYPFHGPDFSVRIFWSGHRVFVRSIVYILLVRTVYRFEVHTGSLFGPGFFSFPNLDQISLRMFFSVRSTFQILIGFQSGIRTSDFGSDFYKNGKRKSGPTVPDRLIYPDQSGFSVRRTKLEALCDL